MTVHKLYDGAIIRSHELCQCGGYAISVILPVCSVTAKVMSL